MSSSSDAFEYYPPPGEDIQNKQNEIHALRLLVAQRRLYTRAKRWQGMRWVGLLILGIGAPVVSLLVPGSAIVAGAVTGLWLFVARTVLSWLEAKEMSKAACVQEELDQYIFGMPLPIVRSERPTPEEIEHLLRGDDVVHIATREKLLDWYPIDPRVSSLRVVAIAQRANASYTGQLIRTTVKLWAIVTLAWVVLLITWASLQGTTLSNFLLGALFPVLPAFLDVVEYVISTWKAAKDRYDLASTIEQRLSPQGQDIDGQDLLVWQERLFDLRRSTPQVPDWLYKAMRTRNEQAMHAAARQLGTPS